MTADTKEFADLPPEGEVHGHSQLAGCQALDALHPNVQGISLAGQRTVEAGLMDELLGAAARGHSSTGSSPLCLAQLLHGCTS